MTILTQHHSHTPVFNQHFLALIWFVLWSQYPPSTLILYGERSIWYQGQCVRRVWHWYNVPSLTQVHWHRIANTESAKSMTPHGSLVTLFMVIWAQLHSALVSIKVLQVTVGVWSNWQWQGCHLVWSLSWCEASFSRFFALDSGVHIISVPVDGQ
jgi:hypothetical protein